MRSAILPAHDRAAVAAKGQRIAAALTTVALDPATRLPMAERLALAALALAVVRRPTAAPARRRPTTFRSSPAPSRGSSGTPSLGSDRPVNFLEITMSVFTCIGGTAARLPSLPPPAPLSSLSVALSRRAAIFGAVVSTGVLAGTGARALAPSELVPDSMPALYAEDRALRAKAERATSDAEVDRLCERLTDLERRAAAVRVTTRAGAVAALEWVRADLAREDGTATDFGFYPALIGQALGVLRTMGDAS